MDGLIDLYIITNLFGERLYAKAAVGKKIKYDSFEVILPMQNWIESLPGGMNVDYLSK